MIYSSKWEVRGIGNRNFDLALFEQMGLFAKRLEANLKAEAPVGKGPGAGKLKKEIKMKTQFVGSKFVGEFTGVDYIKYVIGDTRAHEITPRVARVLRIVGLSPLSPPGGPSKNKAGNVVFTMHVSHPGTTANNFIERAVRKTTEGPSRRMMEQALADAFMGSIGGDR